MYSRELQNKLLKIACDYSFELIGRDKTIVLKV